MISPRIQEVLNKDSLLWTTEEVAQIRLLFPLLKNREFLACWERGYRDTLIVFGKTPRTVKKWIQGNLELTNQYKEKFGVFDPKSTINLKNVDYILIEGWTKNEAYSHLASSGLIEYHNWREIASVFIPQTGKIGSR